jgi:hypothetical protein
MTGTSTTCPRTSTARCSLLLLLGLVLLHRRLPCLLLWCGPCACRFLPYPDNVLEPCVISHQQLRHKAGKLVT